LGLTFSYKQAYSIEKCRRGLLLLITVFIYA
jgi:hypothetical protein